MFDAMKRLADRKVLRRFRKADDGAAAVEFALVAAPFLALLFACIQTAIIFFASQSLETAVSDSGRLILTGQAQEGNFDASKFKQSVCSRMFAMFDCGQLKIDVRTANSFASANLSKPIDSNGNLVPNFTFDPGTPGQIVIVRLFYEWPVYVNLLGFNLSDMAGGKRLLMATSAFRNEPYK